ncbi:restriction endonuclease subunit S [Sinomonas sp. P47F7]|uniref:restriction endonuclease subunit S n=1 Tax=Sinomonas sp. P47F7 TaxID=3410987 RepID=UPI003BF4AE55
MRAADGEFPILSMTMRDGLVPQSERFKKRVAGNDLSQYRVVRRGQLVVGFPIDEGVLAFQNLTDHGIVSPAYGVWDLIDTDGTDPSYLERYLRSESAIKFYSARLKGSTARRRSLPNQVFTEMPVPLPSFDEQRRIAAILEKADTLCAKRREVISQLESLATSLFQEMFGNPAGRGRGWGMKKLGELGKVTTGNTPPRIDLTNFGGFIEWIKSDNINPPQTYLSTAAEGLSESGARKARIVDAGSILMTCIAGSPGVIGNVALTDRRIAFNQQINAFTPHNGPALYWHALLRNLKPSVQAASTGGMKGLVSKSALEGVLAIDVPVDQQDQFARKAKFIEDMRSRLSGQMKGLEGLRASLQHRAFNGGL